MHPDGYDMGSMKDGKEENKNTTQDQEEDEDSGNEGETENLMIGQKGVKVSINDFQLLTVIGRGSFGKVYLVRKKSDGKPYAMKILKKDQLVKKNLLVKT